MLEAIVAAIFILFTLVALVGPFILYIPSKKDRKLQKKQEIANMFCDFYTTITGEKVQIIVKPNSEYEYIITKQEDE